MYTLKNWVLKKQYRDGWPWYRAIGEAVDSEGRTNGHRMYTSPISEITIAGDGIGVMTQHSVYRLMYADAHDRSLETSLDVAAELVGSALPDGLKERARALRNEAEEKKSPGRKRTTGGPGTSR